MRAHPGGEVSHAAATTRGDGRTRVVGPPAPNREEPMTTISVTIAPESKIKVDPSSDVYRSETHPLDALFLPQSVAVVGASERPGSVGRSVLWNLLSSPFGGTVFPINSKRPNVLGIKAYPSLTDLPDKVDLVVVSTPADTVPDLIAEAVELGIPAGIVISAGFKEHGEHGQE